MRMGRIIVVVAILVALVGCGDDSTDGDGSSSGNGGDPAAERIKIGVAYPDLEAFETLNPAFSIGDPEAQAEAMLEGWRRDGELPVNDHEIEFVYRKYNIISDDDKLAACTGFAQDDRVFAVIAGRDFNTGATCLATRFGIPVIDTNSASESAYQQGAPFYFTLRTDQSSYLRSVAAWADESGYLDGKTIGLFYETRLDEAIEVFRQELADRGHQIAEEISASGEGVGSPQDQIAVQRFSEGGVDLAILAVGGSSSINFMTFADRQGYEPDYLDFDYGEHTTDVAAKPNPKSQYNGTRALTITRIGETAAGMDLSEPAEACVENFRRFSGEDLDAGPPETGEWSNVLLTCDLGMILLEGLRGVEGDLTAESFVASLESIDSMELASSGDLSFSADDHSGVDEVREIVWDSDCPCWSATGDFMPVTRADGAGAGG